eukprot:CAMPEP_0182463566 /NCGR_PEP_ID=MMETSP1319-20130603/7712_1 /TAXON_ID=172717 /ORGANISM="Bolidomonas pacifica, Strain RCC208" /LENGTH=235 /DNA_ID=CAMNT_0024663129 /DNA_START=14 /DNA_END=721 /DNA_ORIENTATION=+
MKLLLAALLANACSAFTLSSLASPRPAFSLRGVASETAVVCIEYQNEFTTEGGKLHDAVKPVMDATNMMSNTKKVVDEARKAGALVVHVPISFAKGHKAINGQYGILNGVKEGLAFEAGTWGAEICDEMSPEEGDIVVGGKTGLCGFASTNLDMVLRQNGVKDVALCGFLTNCCVESSMRSAYELGYNVKTLTDCVAATSMEAQEATLEHNFGMFSIPMTSEDFVKDLEKSATPA